MTTPNLPASSPRILLKVEEAARVLGIGRTLMYSLVMSGEVESVPIGRLRRIPADCLTEYVARLRATNQVQPNAA
ncbi:hypothetical protein GCM10009557_20140 [Virgisporangium ochraceum]|uniref:Helix-turn-helix domain-containing protein n=1 Tax=Virgisporangium ochraceum TaxID=65505 RepID=A0A8J3ZPR1_9ACTN|nr:helix-turn-helix domain-containing protein [Virgisporangium ochraceum]GIJ65648.1 hypothetical protein Voc01_005650 [Virgisporangium ochraceum]